MLRYQRFDYLRSTFHKLCYICKWVFHVHAISKSSEKEIVVDGGYLEPDKMNFYDRKGNLLKGATKGSLKKTTKETGIQNKAIGGMIDKPLIGGNRYI